MNVFQANTSMQLEYFLLRWAISKGQNWLAMKCAGQILKTNHFLLKIPPFFTRISIPITNYLLIDFNKSTPPQGHQKHDLADNKQDGTTAA